MLRAVCGPPGRWPQTISLQHIEIRQEAYKVIGPNAPHYRPQSTNVAIVVTNRKSTYDHDKTMPSAMKRRNKECTMLSRGMSSLFLTIEG